jgi:hypothetical protein
VPRITVNVSEEVEEWIEAEADVLDGSKAQIGGHCITVMYNTVDHINLHQDTVQQTASDPNDELHTRLDDLEERVDELEMSHDEQTTGSEPSTEPPLESDQSVIAGSDDTVITGEDEVNQISAVLDDWEKGRSDEEQQANERVAEKSLEWLKEQDERVTKSDVPIGEFASVDSQDRANDTIWTEVIRDAWTHAVDHNLVEQPTARSYRWRSDNS